MKRFACRLACLAILSVPAATVFAEMPHWGYEGEEGPEHWGALTADYGVCQAGRNQSPVNIGATVDAGLPKLTFHYTSGIKDVVNNGHTVQANFVPGSYLEMGKRRFELVQLHFHTPSENTFSGKHFAMEGHLVHRDANGALAVVAVMFDRAKEHPAVSQLWYQMPAHAGDTVPFGGQLTAAAFLPARHDYYYFDGSLTTPPCSEGVAWIVLRHPVHVGSAQIQQFEHTIGHSNNRPVQPINARLILH